MKRAEQPRCPTCGSTLCEESVGPSVFFRCPRCKAGWFSRTELESLLDLPSEQWRLPLDDAAGSEGGPTTAFACLCGVEMRQRWFDSARLDICPACPTLRISIGDLRYLLERHSGDGARLLDLIEH